MHPSTASRATRLVWLLCGLVTVGPSAAGCRDRSDPAAGAATRSGEGAEASLAADPRPLAGAHEHNHDLVPFAECPVPSDERDDPDRFLDRASHSYSAGEMAIAYACAEIAATMVPTSVDAHHIRAAAASALGRYQVAQMAFALALALDPDDPETLAAAAEFYINVLPPRRRDTTRVGLEYARRGRARAVVRRRTGRSLRARLAVLEAQGYNDLGRSEDALERVEEALELAPGSIEASHERGVALFNLCRFEDAQAAFRAVLAEAEDNPYAHHHLGLIYEQMGQAAEGERHFERARELAPTELWAPVLLPMDEFRAELTRAVGDLPKELRSRLAGVSVEVVDIPDKADLLAVNPPFSPTILGLFRGLPSDVASRPGAEPGPERAIVLYRKNLARAVKTKAELKEQIRRTLLHEIGHLSGLDEDDLRRRGLD